MVMDAGKSRTHVQYKVVERRSSVEIVSLFEFLDDIRFLFVNIQT